MHIFDYTRQLDIVDPENLNTPITIIGAGGIGSPTAFLLGKMGCSNIRVIDFDRVEEHNLPNQALYGPHDVGTPKVVALQHVLSRFGIPIEAEQAKASSRWNFSGIVIFAVDSMEARKELLNAVEFDANVDLVVDARMGGTDGYVLAFDPRDPDGVATYSDMLFTDEDADDMSCTAQAVIFVPFAVASLIARIVSLFTAREWKPSDVYLGTTNFQGEPVVTSDSMYASLE